MARSKFQFDPNDYLGRAVQLGAVAAAVRAVGVKVSARFVLLYTVYCAHMNALNVCFGALLLDDI